MMWEEPAAAGIEEDKKEKEIASYTFRNEFCCCPASKEPCIIEG